MPFFTLTHHLGPGDVGTGLVAKNHTTADAAVVAVAVVVGVGYVAAASAAAGYEAAAVAVVICLTGLGQRPSWGATGATAAIIGETSGAERTGGVAAGGGGGGGGGGGAAATHAED